MESPGWFILPTLWIVKSGHKNKTAAWHMYFCWGKWIKGVCHITKHKEDSDD